MSRAQDLFDKATDAYDKAIALIKQAYRIYQSTAQQADSAATDETTTLARFDWILQAILLSESLSDGYFDRMERQFVDKIADHGDLLAYLKEKTKGELSLTWSGIAKMSTDTHKKLIEMLPDLLDEICDAFVRPLVAAESALNEYDFLDALTRLIGQIGTYLAYVDGECEEIEVDHCAKMARSLLIDRWHQLKSEL
jgi:hypothetical protein